MIQNPHTTDLDEMECQTAGLPLRPGPALHAGGDWGSPGVGASRRQPGSHERKHSRERDARARLPDVRFVAWPSPCKTLVSYRADKLSAFSRAEAENTAQERLSEREKESSQEKRENTATEGEGREGLGVTWSDVE